MDIITPYIGPLVFVILSILLIAAIIRALYALWEREDIQQSTKILWMIFFFVAPFVGILCYMLFGGRSDVYEKTE